MAELPLTGGCLCGAVRFEIDEPLVWAGYCHCTRCQRRTGTAASANAAVDSGMLRIVAGEEHVRDWRHPDGGAVKCFCDVCGGALWSRNPETGGFGVRLGTIDGDPGVRPAYHQYVDYAVPWEAVPDDGLVRYPEHRTANKENH